jgi:hypothetical protein
MEADQRGREEKPLHVVIVAIEAYIPTAQQILTTIVKRSIDDE